MKEEKEEKKGFILHNVQGTPFSIIEQNLECKIVIGNNLATEKTFRNTKEAKRYIFSKPWELIGVLVVKILKAQKEHGQKEIQKEENDTQNNN